MAKVDPITGKKIIEIPQSYEVQTITTKDIAVVTVEELIGETEIKQSESVQKEELKEVIETVLESPPEDGWTTVVLDSQALSVFMACPQKFDYVFNRHLKPVGGLSKSINRGSIIHLALLGYWKERIKSGDYQVATQTAIRSAKTEIEKDINFSSEDKLDILQNLLEFLKYIQASSWIPLEAEKYFKVLIFEDEGLKLRIYIDGRIDLLLRTPQIAVLPVDVKTESERWFYTQMSNQFRIYCLACQVNLLGVQRFGFQTSLEPKDKFKLELLPFDQDILDEFRTITLPYWVKQMLLANEDKYYPMNSTSCISGHFKCQFSDGYNGGICNVSRSVREQKLARYFVVGEEWDPSNI